MTGKDWNIDGGRFEARNYHRDVTLTVDYDGFVHIDSQDACVSLHLTDSQVTALYNFLAESIFDREDIT